MHHYGNDTNEHATDSGIGKEPTVDKFDTSIKDEYNPKGNPHVQVKRSQEVKPFCNGQRFRNQKANGVVGMRCHIINVLFSFGFYVKVSEGYVTKAILKKWFAFIYRIK